MVSAVASKSKARRRNDSSAGVSLEAIEKATGRSWTHWARVLDRFDVRRNGHKAAAKHLLAEHGASPWWSQMLTVRYELEHGLRQPLQRSDRTFAVTVQRTIRASLPAAWKAWTIRSDAARWLPGLDVLDARRGGRIAPLLGAEGEFTRVDRQERLRLVWRLRHVVRGTIEVRFSKKPGGRVLVGVGHTGISSRKEADALKRRWRTHVDSLKAFLEAD